MKTIEFAVNKELRAVRNYGVFVIVAFFVLNTTTLATLNWFEHNDLRHELITLSEKLPLRDDPQTEHSFTLPDDVISLQVSTIEHVGFYETQIVGKDYLAYAHPDKNYILMKSEDTIQSETKNFTLALLALFAGEVIIILGWWFFIRARVRQLFDIK